MIISSFRKILFLSYYYACRVHGMYIFQKSYFGPKIKEMAHLCYFSIFLLPSYIILERYLDHTRKVKVYVELYFSS